MSLIEHMIKAGWTHAQPKTCAYWDRESNFCALHRPSAQPERKTGRWIKISPAGIYECSECHGHIMTKDIDCFDFCHRCGVKMEGVK